MESFSVEKSLSGTFQEAMKMGHVKRSREPGHKSGSHNTALGLLDNKKLRELRKKRGLTQIGLEDAAEIDVQTISRLERSPCKASTETLVKLARYFDVPCGFLLGEASADVVDYYEGQPEFIAQVNRFLRLLSEKAKHQPSELLNVFCALLEADPERLISVPEAMLKEERVFGLWWSILAAYEKADWVRMSTKAEDLKQLAEELHRPFLVAVARAYKAQALCQMGTEAELVQAKGELDMVPKDSQLFESAVIYRLRAKVLRRQNKVREALEMCNKAKQIMDKAGRDDVLFLFEKVKLMRYLGVLNSRVARQMGDDHDAAWQKHMMEGNKYFEECETAIKDLEKELPREAKVEEMLLAFTKARHFEIYGQFKDAYDSALQALELAQENHDDDYYAEVKMFLVHICTQLRRKGEAAEYFGSLLPLSKHSTERLKRYCRKWVVPYKDRLSE